jgi:hypothetical protein
MLSHFSYYCSAQPFHVIKCSGIHRAIVVSHFSELNHFPLLQCSTIPRATVLNHSSCSVILVNWAIFYCYSAQISHFSTVVKHFVILSAILLQCSVVLTFLQCLVIYDFVSHSWNPVRYFATVLSHFMTLSTILEILSVILIRCSSILHNSSVVLKIPSAILSNDYCGLAGQKAA